MLPEIVEPCETAESAPDEVYQNFVKKVKGYTFPQMLSIRTALQIERPSDITARDLSKQIWDASVRYCREHISPEQYIAEYTDFKVDIRLPKEKTQELIEKLVFMTGETEIKEFLNRSESGDGWWFCPSDYTCVFLAKASQPKTILEVLKRCGRVSKPMAS